MFADCKSYFGVIIKIALIEFDKTRVVSKISSDRKKKSGGR